MLAADTQTNTGGSLLIFLIPILLLFGLMWWNTRKRQRDQQNVTKSIGIGQDVVLRNGAVVTIVAENDEYITVEVSPGVTQRWVPGAVARPITPKPIVNDSPGDSSVDPDDQPPTT